MQNEFQVIVTEIGKGKGTLGKLVADDTVYNKLNATVDKVNSIVDETPTPARVPRGKFLKDPALFNNANQGNCSTGHGRHQYRQGHAGQAR